MSEVNICMLHPGFPAVSNAIRHTLRDLYGFVPLNLGEELAEHVHDAVSSYQKALAADVESLEETT